VIFRPVLGQGISFNAEDFSHDSSINAEFVGCQFIGIDFSEFNFSRLKFLDCTFSECNLSNASLKSGVFRGVSFKKSKLIGLNWTETTTLASCTYADCIMDYGVFHSMNLKGFSFINCKMMEVEFWDSQLAKSSLTGCMLRGSAFNKADLSGADLRGSTDYFIDVRFTNVKKAKFSMPEAMALLSSLEIIIDN
jgi:fluoroquinolone resistance protein